MRKLFIFLLLWAFPFLVYAGDIDANTIIMLHCNGVENGTTFPDASISNHTFTASGDAVSNTTIKMFGNASLFVNGAGVLTAADSADWDLGTGNFTIDYWSRWINLDVTSGGVDVGHYQDNKGVLTAQYAAGAKGCAYLNGGADDIATTFVPNFDTWYHIAVVRTGENLLYFVNGSLLANVSNTENISGGTSCTIGGDIVYHKGFMDEIRVSNVARWTANFTPSSGEYSEDTTVPNITDFTVITGATNGLINASFTFDDPESNVTQVEIALARAGADLPTGAHTGTETDFFNWTVFKPILKSTSNELPAIDALNGTYAVDIKLPDCGSVYATASINSVGGWSNWTANDSATVKGDCAGTGTGGQINYPFGD